MKTPNRFLALTVAAFGAAAVLATPAAAEVHVGFSVNLPAPPLPPLPFPSPNLRVGFGGPHARYLPPLPPLPVPPSVTYRSYVPGPRVGWIWVAGYWERNAYDRAYWVPGHWVRSGRAYGYGYGRPGRYGRYDRHDRYDRYDHRDRDDRYRDRDDDRR